MVKKNLESIGLLCEGFQMNQAIPVFRDMIEICLNTIETKSESWKTWKILFFIATIWPGTRLLAMKASSYNSLSNILFLPSLSGPLNAVKIIHYTFLFISYGSDIYRCFPIALSFLSFCKQFWIERTWHRQLYSTGGKKDPESSWPPLVFHSTLFLLTPSCSIFWKYWPILISQCLDSSKPLYQAICYKNVNQHVQWERST